MSILVEISTEDERLTGPREADVMRAAAQELVGNKVRIVAIMPSELAAHLIRAHQVATAMAEAVTTATKEQDYDDKTRH